MPPESMPPETTTPETMPSGIMPPGTSGRKLLPLLGRDAVAPADVFALCQNAFWLRRHLACDESYAKRQVLLVGFHALAGLKVPTVCKIEFANCFPDDLMVKIEFGGELEDVPITPALARLLKDWMEVRPASVSGKLFATADGPITRNTLAMAMATMGRTFGMPRFADALIGFFKANLHGENAKADEAAAARAYVTRAMARAGVTFEAIGRLVRRTDPFKESARFIGDPTLQGWQDLVGASALPATYDDCLDEDAFGRKGPRSWRLAADHPLVIDLTSYVWPKKRREAVAARAALYDKHAELIDGLIAEGAVSIAQLAQLFAMSKVGFVKLRRRRLAARAAGPPGMGSGKAQAKRKCGDKGGGTAACAVAAFADPSCLAFASVERLRRVRWPKNPKRRVGLREPLFEKYGAEIERLVAEGRLLMREADALFGYAKNGFRFRLARARREAAGIPANRHPLYDVADCSAEERKRLNKIADLRWPAGEARVAFGLEVLRKHAAFVCTLVDARKLRVADAASLLGMSKGRFTLLRAEFKAGTLDFALAPHAQGDRDLWRELVLRELEARPAGQGVVAFCTGLRRRYGMSLPFDFVRHVVETVGRIPATPKRATPAPPTATAEERVRIDAIAATDWKEGFEDETRRALLKDHFAFVFVMIDARKVSMAQAGRLFRVRQDLMTQLRADFRAGCFDWALRPPLSETERRRWRALVRREWPKRPEGQTPNEFCRALRKRFDFPLPFSAINNVLAHMRLHDPHEPSLYSEPRRMRQELTDLDRRVVRSLVKADWSGVADVEALRRELLVEHLGAVVVMLDAWKLDMARAAELFRMSKTKMARLCREHREGTFELAVAPPATREEKEAARETVVAEIAIRGVVDNVPDFWHRLRRERRLPLSLHEVRHLVRSCAAAEAEAIAA
ncbi:MAG: hypothetical protein QHD01_02840 [Bradyrhizobium sp.]|uniref:hypothetical protein n=1 Tax=Bradyrhizobium sp. TaxID=376 RepID=UPI0029B2122A|nr:hypothetical protein [Bradyrhizobium sp.]MDX3965521.1 hypothetical protein [Bradyrhizobium sp.]